MLQVVGRITALERNSHAAALVYVIDHLHRGDGTTIKGR
jgi:hypothetical protein